MANIEFTISGTAAGALQIDTRNVVSAISRRHGRGTRVTVICVRAVAEELLNEAEDRFTSSGEGWYQPASWRAACGDAAHEIRAALVR